VALISASFAYVDVTGNVMSIGGTLVHADKVVELMNAHGGLDAKSVHTMTVLQRILYLIVRKFFLEILLFRIL
jgi:hypothetical protein